MTPDKTPTPTDADLKAFAIAEQFMLFCEEDEFIDIARAVLAKWGSPVVAGEPVAHLHDDGYWTPAKTEAGRQLNDRLMCAGSPKIAVFTTPQPTQAQAGAVPPIEWPKARDVGRIGDMSPSAHLRVGFDSDNDVFVSVWDERGGGSIEFCNPGGGGGGQSSRTRLALIALMVAMEADNAEKPSRDWWALRMGGIKEGGQHG